MKEKHSLDLLRSALSVGYTVNQERQIISDNLMKLFYAGLIDAKEIHKFDMNIALNEDTYIRLGLNGINAKRFISNPVMSSISVEYSNKSPRAKMEGVFLECNKCHKQGVGMYSKVANSIVCISCKTITAAVAMPNRVWIEKRCPIAKCSELLYYSWSHQHGKKVKTCQYHGQLCACDCHNTSGFRFEHDIPCCDGSLMSI